MEFRPCIDIHDGKVKQIVGGSISDSTPDKLLSNFVSDRDALYYASLYKRYGLKGGHIALLNRSGTQEYERDTEEACKALAEFKGGLQIGGGVNDENAGGFIDAGASHVIVTSFIFEDKKLSMKRLQRLKEAVGREHIVLDLSCRLKDERYFVVTDRWQTFTEAEVEPSLFGVLSEYCDEFLIHAADIEGLKAGIDERLIGILGSIPYTVTYAGGVSSYEDIGLIKRHGGGRVNFTIGSGLDIFGGSLKLTEVIECTRS
ncbi:MAG: phosphoribosylformimino-5-aminoimidazole carboxamide ribotide isomerase [Lachnospiraceae bacterium]|nr:phosphoribosylformimino-5-aminoimidazole carboxamide ribotide isomerase [Lachnospiraceae bacterium]